MAEKKTKKNEKEAEHASGASERPLLSEKKTPKSLKPERKIVKRTIQKKSAEKRSPSRNPLKTKRAKGALEIREEKDKQKKQSESHVTEGTSDNKAHDAKKLKNKERNKERNKQKNIIYENKNDKDQQKNDKDQQKKDKDKHHKLEMSLENKKNKEKLGGLIFMCSAKTKPDCFHYRVMGVSMSKKDLVLGVKPGLKLFLYDFDLKLMYGIYKASSSGGIKLEPEAFDGAFPVQVRFTVHMDCYPLPESIFKKAIKDNYDKNYKFKTELSMEQAKKLTKLFRPAEIHSKAPRNHSPTTAELDKEVYRRGRESRPRSHRKLFPRDSNTIGNARNHPMMSHETHHPVAYREAASMRSQEFSRDSFMNEKEYRTYGLQRTSARGDRQSYPLLSYERHQPIAYKEVASIREDEFPHGSFMSEKEYRAYGLRRGSRNMTPPPAANEREHLPRHLAPRYRDVAHGHGEHVSRDLPYVNELEYQTHGLHAGQELPLSVIPATVDAIATTAVVERRYHPEPHVRGEPLHQHSLSVNEGEYLTSHLGARHELSSAIPAPTATIASAYSRDPYYTTHYDLHVDPYPPPRREEVSAGSYFLSGRTQPHLAETDHVQRRETDSMGRIYSTYTSDAPSYNLRHRNQEARPEPRHVPVSSLYSFAGPSSLYP